MLLVICNAAGRDWGGWTWSGGGWSWLWPIWVVVALLFWAGLIALMIWAVRLTFASRRNAEPTRETAFEILRRRLASGEITPEEFDHIRQLLED